MRRTLDRAFDVDDGLEGAFAARDAHLQGFHPELAQKPETILGEISRALMAYTQTKTRH